MVHIRLYAIVVDPAKGLNVEDGEYEMDGFRRAKTQANKDKMIDIIVNNQKFRNDWLIIRMGGIAEKLKKKVAEAIDE